MVEMSFSYGHTTRDKFSDFRYELIGTDGMIHYHREASLFELRTHQETRQLEYHHEKNFAEMWRDFEKLLRTGDYGNLCTAEDALRVTEIARTATDQCIVDRVKPRAASKPKAKAVGKAGKAGKTKKKTRKRA